MEWMSHHRQVMKLMRNNWRIHQYIITASMQRNLNQEDKVAKLIKKQGIHPDSLTPAYKEALELYMKESVVSDSDDDSDDL